ncbi:MAG: GNAT family N-acetyltransferase [Sulfobacillus sp.]|nr:GNAT family N-acetyltransferase [Sulfobacillus sp.]
MEIRTYRGGDDPAIIAAWNRACPTDPITLGVWVRRVLTDANFDPAGLWLAWDHHRVASMVLGVRRRIPLFGTDLEETGWVTVFFTDPDYRGHHLSEQLFEAVEATMRRWGRRRIQFSPYVPHYFLPGLDSSTYPAAASVLRRRGYRVFDTVVAMDKDLVGYQIPDDIRRFEMARQAEGFVVEPIRLEYLYPLLEFVHTVFKADWGRAVREAVAGGIAERVWIVRQGPDIIGFALFGGYDGVGERFGPFGIHPDFRGLGLGKWLLHRVMAQMRAEGLHHAWFLWTEEEEPAGYLYRKAGFVVTRRFDLWEKTLTDLPSMPARENTRRDQG